MPQQNEKNKLLDESMQRAYAKVAAEMPDVKRVAVTPSNQSWMTRIFMPRGSQAVTNPFTGNITYNPDAMQGMAPEDIEQALAHELTHVRQTQNMPWYQKVASLFTDNPGVPAGISGSSPLNDPYYWKPSEMEAFQTERDRATRMKLPWYRDPVLGTGDIMLPSPRKGIDTAPSSMRKR